MDIKSSVGLTEYQLALNNYESSASQCTGASTFFWRNGCCKGALCDSDYTWAKAKDMRFLYDLDEVSPASFTASLPREIQVQDDSSSGGRVGRRLQCEQRQRKGHNNMEQESAPGLTANKGLSNSDPVQGTTNIVIEKSHSKCLV